MWGKCIWKWKAGRPRGGVLSSLCSDVCAHRVKKEMGWGLDLSLGRLEDPALGDISPIAGG